MNEMHDYEEGTSDERQPVKGRLPCDWGVETLWSMCGWQVKTV